MAKRIQVGDLVQLRGTASRHERFSAAAKKDIYIVTWMPENFPWVHLPAGTKITLSCLLTLQPYPHRIRLKNLKKYLNKRYK